MRVVLDTNILISAIVFGGKPRVIFELIVVDKLVQSFTSKFLLDELLGVLKKKFDLSNPGLNEIKETIKGNFQIIKPKSIPRTIKEDAIDNQVLATALESKADYIITGDNHLLKLKVFKSILIITPQEFIRKFKL